MYNIKDVHDDVLDFLEDYKSLEIQRNEPFYFTLRRTNQYKRLSKGYWFHGNDDYLAVSFWNGMDWKNKTPNIFLRIEVNGRCSLTVSCKDSIRKAEVCKTFLLERLGVSPNGTDRWTKFYEDSDFLELLERFLKNDKLLIDQIIKENIQEFQSEDLSNSIRFIATVDFERWVNTINKFREGGQSIPISLKTFDVENFTPIKKAGFGRLTKQIPFIFLVGDNGSGKSSLLKALAFGLGNKFLEADFGPNSQWLIRLSLNFPGRASRVKIHYKDPQDKILANVPFAAYGPARLVINNRVIRSPVNEMGKDKTSPLWSIFHPDAILLDLNRWLINQLSIKHKNSDLTAVRERYENIKQMLISIIPNLYDIREQAWDDTQELLYFENDFEGVKSEHGVLFEHLSSGIKSLMAMIGDMMLRLFEQQPDIIDPAELAGIVLIDEIDIHLHPKWQKSVPELLHQNFPKIQFIVSTHSPIPLLGAPAKSRIYVVKRSSLNGISIVRMDDKVMFSQILPNAILTSPIFGLDDITPISKKESEAVKVYDDYSEVEFFEKLESDVNRYLDNSKQKELIELFKKEQ